MCGAWRLAKIYRMEIGYTHEQLADAMQDIGAREPDGIVLHTAIRAYGDIGVNPLHNP